MSSIELFTIAVGLSMDAFAVSICKGLSVKKVMPKHCLTAGLYFGAFQAIMPLIGYLLGARFSHLIVSIDHWIAFVLLLFIGSHMIKESREEAEKVSDDFSPKAMLPMAIATSIDALAVGVTLAFLQVDIVSSVIFIGVTTFIFGGLGVYIGNVVGSKFRSVAELFGGIVLIGIGTKILIEHLFFH